MKTHLTDSELPEDLRELFESTPQANEADLKNLGRSIRELDQDPEFRADLLKSLFVDQILAAMENQGVIQSELARRIGKSRQYVSKILDEDASVNFTIESMTALAMALNLRLEQHLLKDHQSAQVWHCLPGPRMEAAPASDLLDTKPARATTVRAFPATHSPFNLKEIDESEHTDLSA